MSDIGKSFPKFDKIDAPKIKKKASQVGHENPSDMLKDATEMLASLKSVGNQGKEELDLGDVREEELIVEMQQFAPEDSGDTILATKGVAISGDYQTGSLRAQPKKPGRGSKLPAWAKGETRSYKTERIEGDINCMEAKRSDNPGLTPSEIDDFEMVRESFFISRTPEPTIVCAIAVDTQDQTANLPSSIRCYGGIALGGYVHDQANDAYLAQCVEFVQVGHIPFAMELSMPNIGVWQVKIPLPSNLLEKHFTPRQRQTMEGMRQKYPSPRFHIHYMQMLGCNV